MFIFDMWCIISRYKQKSVKFNKKVYLVLKSQKSGYLKINFLFGLAKKLIYNISKYWK